MSKIITLLDNFKLVHEQAASKIIEYTPQLYILSGEKKNVITPFGSGVFFRKSNNHYLITAAHCVKQEKLIEVGVMVNQDLHFLKGKVLANSGKDEKIDMAVIKLSEESLSVCKKEYKFLFDNGIINNTESDFENYLMLGWPITKTYINHKKKKILRDPFLYLLEPCKDKEYLKSGFEKKRNILLGFTQRKGVFLGNEQISINPKLKGISGCGLWYIPSYFEKEVSFKLCGIMIEHHSKKNIVIATRIGEAIKLIELFPKYSNQKT